jgi:uncharacterized protein with PIN domain
MFLDASAIIAMLGDEKAGDGFVYLLELLRGSTHANRGIYSLCLR